MNNSIPSSSDKTKNITLKSVIAWLLGIIFAMTGIGNLFSSPISALFFLLTAVVLIPPIMRAVSQKSKINLSRNVRILLALAFLALAGFNIKSNTSISVPVVTTPNPVQNTTPINSTPPVADNAERRITSIVFAQKVIRDTLKSPSTAKFSDVKAYELSNKKDVWAVNGYVDSQNGFGAMIRSIWEVQLDYSDGKGGIVSSILFDGKKIQ